MYQPNYTTLSTDDKRNSLKRVTTVDLNNIPPLFDENLITCTYIPDNVHDIELTDSNLSVTNGTYKKSKIITALLCKCIDYSGKLITHSLL